MNQISLRPIITEKTLDKVKKFNEYTFEVDPDASRYKIKKMIEDIFGVKVVEVRTIKKAGSVKRFMYRFAEKKTPDQKRAVVRLAEGQKIELFGVEEKESTKKLSRKKIK